MSTVRRWLVFNVVGALGILVQLVVLRMLVGLAGLHYLPATALGVSAAVLHNFLWHRAWTWRDREAGGWLRPFVTFVAANGIVSFAGNLAVMTVLVGGLGMAAVPANLIAIATCGVVNFALSDRIVFYRRTQTTISPRSRLAHAKYGTAMTRRSPTDVSSVVTPPSRSSRGTTEKLASNGTFRSSTDPSLSTPSRL